MWKRTSQRKLIDISKAHYIVINDLSEDLFEVIVGFQQREFVVLDMASFEEATKFVDGLQSDLEKEKEEAR